ncbi:MAG: CDP-diacylglycerol--serine O-phosphatidyltransferase [Bacteroidota bacterium]
MNLRVKRHIPNFLTCCNLLCGSIGVVQIFNGRWETTVYLIWIAILFDFLDGFAARLLKVHSPMGKELDSLADMVTFGLLPGLIAFQLINTKTQIQWLPFLGFLITIFSALRLAQFNVDERQSDVFIGLATPANTLFISSLVFVNAEWLSLMFVLTIVILFSYLLVAPIEMIALKFKHFRWKDNEMRYMIIGLSLISILLLQQLALPLIVIVYICLSIAKKLFFGN